MKIYTSYFYKVRFFTSNMIPISTAMWDPKWFHQNKNQDFVWVDKNHVINGVRAANFAPGPIASQFCRGKENCKTGDPNNCAFLRAYSFQLNQIDFKELKKELEKLAEKVRQKTKFEGEPIFVFLVHEAPNNLCSERKSIQQYFANNGIKCIEWEEE